MSTCKQEWVGNAERSGNGGQKTTAYPPCRMTFTMLVLLNIQMDHFHFRKLVQDMPEFYVPEVVNDLTSKRVLTTELISGTPLDKIENPAKDTINKVRWSSN